MAGSEGFDPSLIETEALLKKMKPRPANLSAARIVYEAGRAVGKQEVQAQLAQAGYVLAGASASTPLWKKWFVPSWATAATAICLALLIGRVIRPTHREAPPHDHSHAVHTPNVPAYSNNPSYNSPGYRPAPDYTVAPSEVSPEASSTDSTPAELHVEGKSAPSVSPGTVVGQPKERGSIVHTSNDTENRSGTPRQGRGSAPSPPKEQNLADFFKDLIPPLKSRRGIDIESLQDNMLDAQEGQCLSAIGLIKITSP
jgi:hypothetical protein